MRILVVSNLYPPDALGGYELLCADSAQRWARQGHAVTVLTRASSAIAAATSGSGEPRVVRTFRPRPADPARGGKAVRAWWLRRERRIIEGAVRELRPELIATWGTYGIAPSAISGVYGAGVPTIAFAQDYTLIEHLNRPAPDAAADPLRRAYARALSSLAGERWPRPRPNRWVFPSNAVREEYERALGPLPSRVIHNGIQVPASPPPLPPRGSRLRVGGLGRLVPEKGWLTLVAAAELLAAEDPSSAPEVEIHGPAVDEAFTRQLREAAARASSAGAPVTIGEPLPHEQIGALMARMDCIAIPSEWAEPFAVVMVEALAAGRPIVGTPCGGAAELLSDGETALLHDPGDADGLARALRRLAREPRLADRIAEAGLERVRQECALERIETEIDEAIAEAARS